MVRGEVWWVRFPQPGGVRPALLLSREKAIRVRAMVTVAPLTSRNRGIPTHVSLGVADGLPKDCVVDVDSIETIPKRWFINKVCALAYSKMSLINEGIKLALALD